MQKQSDASNLKELVKTYQSNYNLHERWNKKCSFEEAVFGAITAQYPDLADLDAAEIEDFLCVCKNELFILKNNKS